MDFQDTLINATQILRSLVSKQQIESFALIGGLAIARVALPRATADIDFAIKLNNSTLETVANEIGGIARIGDYQDPLIGTISFHLGEANKGIPIQLIQFPKSLEEITFQDVVMIGIEQTNVPFASWESLLFLKLYAGSPLDLQDARYILLQNPCSEKKLEQLHSTANRLRLSQRLKKILAT